MSKESIRIESNEITDYFRRGGQELSLTYQEKNYHIIQEPDHQVQDQVLDRMIWPTIIQTVLFLIIAGLFFESLIPLSGRQSISGLVIILATVGSAILVTKTFYQAKQRRLPLVANIPWRNYPSLVSAMVVMTLIGLVFFFYLFDQLFYGLAWDIYLSTAFASLLFGTVNYVTLYFMYTFSTHRLVRLMVAVMLGGVIIAMLTNSQGQWWHRHLSYLGSSQAVSAWQFNLTLMLSAFLLVTLVDSLFINLVKIYPEHRGLKCLRGLLTLTALSLGLVGFFPVDGPGAYPDYHNRAAEMLVILVVVMIGGHRLFLPKVRQEFSRLSYIVGGALVLLTLLHMLGTYITLTAFEILSFILAFLWLLMLIQNLEFLLNPPTRTYNLEIK